MQDIAAALESLASYDIEETKRALLLVVERGEKKALEHIMPLTVHPDVAIRYFAKRAVRLLRAPARTTAVEQSSAEENLECLEPLQAGAAGAVDDLGAKAERRRFTAHSNGRRPEYFKVSIVI